MKTPVTISVDVDALYAVKAPMAGLSPTFASARLLLDLIDTILTATRIGGELHNPVSTANSIDAMDLLSQCDAHLRVDAPAALRADMREQIHRHERALRPLIGFDTPSKERT